MQIKYGPVINPKFITNGQENKDIFQTLFQKPDFFPIPFAQIAYQCGEVILGRF